MTEEEDQEMSTIFEIVRLAQGQHVQEILNTTYTDDGNLLPTLSGSLVLV